MRNIMKYILITPAKNEEGYLPDVAKSIINQTVKPSLWLIINDGSTDGTLNYIQQLSDQYNWIKYLSLLNKPRDITFHYSFVCNKGFEIIVKLAYEMDIEYEFIGLVDADTVVEKEYFEKLINQFFKNPKLGVGSGGIYYKKNGKHFLNKTNINRPKGTGRLWRRDCFFSTDRYSLEPAPDSISNVKALLRGWEIKNFNDIMMFQLRETSSAEGLWKGFTTNGWIAYYLNKHPILVLGGSLYFLIRRPYYTGIAYLFGYLKALIKRTPKIKDEEIKNYYWNERLKEYIKLS